MTRICNFPISKTKRCKQPVADDKPNCGRHSTELSVDQLGQNPTVYKKDGELHVWVGKPDGLYCLIHSDPSHRVLYQVAGEVPPCCLDRIVELKDEDGNLHCDNGPAEIWTNSTQFWYQHGKLHRDDGPVIITPNGTREWYQHGECHRADGPAIIESDNRQSWYQHGKQHREDGPADVWADGTQVWYQDGKRHREDGPAIAYASGLSVWYWHGKEVTEEEHARLWKLSLGI